MEIVTVAVRGSEKNWVLTKYDIIKFTVFGKYCLYLGKGTKIQMGVFSPAVLCEMTEILLIINCVWLALRIKGPGILLALAVEKS